jgi:hypothetical protein
VRLLGLLVLRALRARHALLAQTDLLLEHAGLVLGRDAQSLLFFVVSIASPVRRRSRVRSASGAREKTKEKATRSRLEKKPFRTSNCTSAASSSSCASSAVAFLKYALSQSGLSSIHRSASDRAWLTFESFRNEALRLL